MVEDLVMVVVLVGYGRVGRRIASSLKSCGIPYVVAEQNRELIKKLRNQAIPCVFGNAAEPAVLVQPHIAHAAMLVVTTPDPVDVRQIINTARALNPSIEMVLQTRTEDELQLLRKKAIGTVFPDKEELARSMTGYVVKRFEPQAAQA